MVEEKKKVLILKCEVEENKNFSMNKKVTLELNDYTIYGVPRRVQINYPAFKKLNLSLGSKVIIYKSEKSWNIDYPETFRLHGVLYKDY